jgi:hypothetical protein
MLITPNSAGKAQDKSRRSWPARGIVMEAAGNSQEKLARHHQARLVVVVLLDDFHPIRIGVAAVTVAKVVAQAGTDVGHLPDQHGAVLARELPSVRSRP